MAKRNSGRRGRSRKRRPATQGEDDAATGAKAPARAPRPERARAVPAASERPQAPWHPLPLSELLILVGAVGAVIGVKRLNGGVSNAGPVLVAGVLAVAIGTVEVTLREHLSGYRAHTLLLALIPVIALHTVMILILSAFFVVPRWVNVPLLAIDLAVFAILYKVLRMRFLDARRARLYASGG
jgi:hypothetical protein